MLFIHPYDKTTKFLSVIPETFKKRTNIDVRVINIDLNHRAHVDCIQAIQDSPSQSTVIFLGHGGTNYLLGAAGDMANGFLFDESAIEDPKLLYRFGQFINHVNVSVFKDKKVFCLSCNSAEELGPMAINGGAKVFLGFRDIPTDAGEFEKLKLKLDQDGIESFNVSLTSIVTESLIDAIAQKLTFQELKYQIRLRVNKFIGNLVTKDTKNKNRRIVADGLFYFKTGIRTFGDSALFFK